MAKKRYKSDVLASVHEAAADLAKAGHVDKATMRAFDVGCLASVDPLSAREIKAIRERERVSQAVFAAYLHVTTSLVSKWERGEKQPRGASLKLLNLVQRKGLDAVA
jgi:putative transcriptional regulator